MISRRQFGVGALRLFPFLGQINSVYDNVLFDNILGNSNNLRLLNSCPEMFGAESVSVEDYRRSEYADDTNAVQSAINAGVNELFFDGSYIVSSLSISRPIKLVGGTFIKARGSTGKILRIQSADVILKDVQIVSMNASLWGKISQGILIVLEYITGEIHVDGLNGGPMIDGEGVVPGTKIVAVIKMGGVTAYKLNFMQNTDEQLFNYTDATVFNHENDCLHVNGNDVEISGLKILGSAGGGLTSLGAKNLKLNNFNISNVSDNGILISCDSSNIGSDNNQIQNGFINGTGRQNGIFITASAGSVATNSKIQGIKVVNVKVSNCADSALEVGIHVIDAIINKCELGPSFNPALLCRDASRFKISDVSIIQSPTFLQSDLWSALAVIKQTESDTWRCDGVFERIHFKGFANRGFIYVDQSSITIKECTAINDSKAMPDSTDKQTCFAIIGDEISDLIFDNVFVQGWKFGLIMNYSSKSATLGQITVKNSEFINVDYLVDPGRAHCRYFLLRECKFTGLNRLIYRPGFVTIFQQSNTYTDVVQTGLSKY